SPPRPRPSRARSFPSMRGADRGPLGATLLAAATLALAAAPAPVTSGFAIVGATLIDGTGAPARSDTVIGVAGDRIKAVGSPAEARALVQREAARRPDFIKIWFIQRPGEDAAAGRALLDAVVDESRGAGLRVAVHATELEAARAAVDAGAAILVHSVFDKPV